jgi:hypothetical protein
MTAVSESTLQRLRNFRLNGVITALLEQEKSAPTNHDLSFNERLSLLLEAEESKRNNQRISRLLRKALSSYLN